MKKVKRPEKRYRIDELMAAAKVETMNARLAHYYVQIGVLDPPCCRGSRAYYTDAHIEQIQKIAALRTKGKTLADIRDILHPGRTAILAQNPTKTVLPTLRNPRPLHDPEHPDPMDPGIHMQVQSTGHSSMTAGNGMACYALGDGSLLILPPGHKMEAEGVSEISRICQTHRRKT